MGLCWGSLAPQKDLWAGPYPYTHPQALGWGQKFKTLLFSESSHVAYQIKGNGAQSTMQAHIISLHTPRPHPQPVGSGEKDNFFSNCGHVAYQIKGKEI